MSLFAHIIIAQGLIILFTFGSSPLGLITLEASSRTWIAVEQVQDSELTFRHLLAGSGKTEDGSWFSFAVSEASDGVKISARTEKRRSASRAKAVLKRTLRQAEILERGPKLNSHGQRVGERVVAHFRSKDQNDSRSVVLWTDGSDFHYLESRSLPHLLAFEKKNYP